MAVDWEQIVVECHDPVALGRWWAAALQWAVVNDDPAEFEIQPAPGRTPGMIFLSVPGAKTAKNRIHVDLRPTDQAAEVERILALGATRVDVGQGVVSWVVLADPEENEFCILGDRTSAEGSSDRDLFPAR